MPGQPAEDSEMDGESEGDEMAEDADMGEAEGEEEILNEVAGDGEHPGADALVS